MDAQISGSWPVVEKAVVSSDGGKAMSRWNAAGIHLGISAMIAAVVLAVIYLVWYPGPYFKAMGGDQLLLLLIGVDVVIGPLITLFFFKAGKQGLMFDLTVIAFLQSAALMYGVSVAAQARPVYSVFVVDRFETVTANALDPAEQARVKRPEFQSLSWTGPHRAGVVKPDDPQEANRILFAMVEGKDLQHFPQHFVPYAEIAAEAGRRAQSIETLRHYNRQSATEIDAFLDRHGVKESEVGFLPLRARRGELSVIVKRSSGEIVATLPLSSRGN
jgi:hypothetical protein